MGGAFKRPPPAGGGKSRGPAGRGLNCESKLETLRLKDFNNCAFVTMQIQRSKLNY